MSRFLKIEFNRVFKSKTFLAALALGFLIVLVQQITVARYYSLAEENVFLYLTGYDTTGLGTNLYYLLLPCLVALAGADLLGEDRRGGLDIFSRIRGNDKQYYFSKSIVAFIAGGVVFCLPLIMELCALMLVYPSAPLDYFVAEVEVPVTYGAMFSNIFYNSPLTYELIFLVIGFAYGGLFALIGILVSFFSSSKYVVLLSPLAIYYGVWIVFSLIGYPEFSPFGFLTPKQGYPLNFHIIWIEFLLFLVVIIMGIIWSVKNEKS
ncbi:hypothetical protein L0903_000978 [Listeria innocua]|nr:hypothetical protein [Listeria innocua]EIS4928935.1 hypothetical protein [Listeria innocua]EIS4931143.1 hypothetical protein [Listeria innocua]EIS4940342.1 hypothetical protein [Listeria innocua]EIS4943715.1 hypothetical protein [Listeria innocua]